MLGASLSHRGVELLRRVDDLEGAAAKGSTAGIPLLYPWANRLAGPRYRVAGREVALDPASPLLHFDERGLPMHGVPWSRLVWEVVASEETRLVSGLEWDRPELLAVFPFPHRVELAATLRPDALTIETTVVAGPVGPVPVAFGFHPYFGVPALPRAAWRLELPAMARLALDDRGIPTGQETPFSPVDAVLGGLAFDDGFALQADSAVFGISDRDLRITVRFLEGYAFAQIYAPPDQDFIALEPMTAPTNALASGRGLRVVQPGEQFRAVFRIGVRR